MLLSKGNRGEKSKWRCDWCKKQFEITNGRATEAHKKNHNKFCSPKCKTEYWKKNASKRVVNYIKNNTHPNFKGGIGITTDGYVWVRIVGKKQNKIKLHRYLMEIKLGRKLKPCEIVHHKNYDKFDNRIENLKITTIAEHNKEHRYFTKENRDDIYSERENKLILSDLTNGEILRKLPHRTLDAINTQRCRLKRR